MFGGDQVFELANFNADMLAGLVQLLLKGGNIFTIAAKLSSRCCPLFGISSGTVDEFDALERGGG